MYYVDTARCYSHSW